jgi:hypothetical protein
MKHLKVAASVVNLAIFVSCSISCSSVPRPPPGPSDMQCWPHIFPAQWLMAKLR